MHMGIIGVLSFASLGEANISSTLPSSSGSVQKAGSEEALSLLQMVVESCKSLPLARGFFYDELAGLVGYTKLHPSIIEWISKHT
jgi:hypothetical protein